MGNCQSATSADTPSSPLPPSATPTREPQPYSNNKPVKEDLGGKRPDSKAKSNKGVQPSQEKGARPPEGPRSSKPSSSTSSSPSASSPSSSKPKKETAPTPPKSNKNDPDIEDQWRDCDNSRWRLRQHQFNGSVQYKDIGKQEVVEGQSVEKGIALFKSNPAKFVAMIYQTNMVTDNWPASSCMYTLVHRKGTESYTPTGMNPKGFQTILLHEYERLPPFKDNVLPKAHRDKYTDTMTHHGRQLHTPTRLPIMPGRGMGVCDAPNLKIIGDVDPSDIHQGAVREKMADAL